MKSAFYLEHQDDRTLSYRELSTAEDSIGLEARPLEQGAWVEAAHPVGVAVRVARRVDGLIHLKHVKITDSETET